MLRNFLFLIAMVAIAATAGWVAEHPGALMVEWFGYRIETSAAFLLLAIVGVTLILWLVIRAATALVTMPRNLAHKRTGLQQERGLQALTDAFVALGEQDTAAAKKYIKEAERYLPNPALPRLLSLQIARQQGDDRALREQFAELQHSPQTRPLALRGMVEEARREDRMAEALSQAEELLKLRPKHKPTILLLLDLYSYHRRWQEALLLISRSQKRLLLSGSEARHYAALIYLEQAQAMLNEQNRGSAVEMLRSALKKDPGLTAAVLLLAELYLQTNKIKSASAILRKAWHIQPHPDIATLYDKAHSSLAPEKRLQKMQELVRSNAQDWESLLAVGRSAMNARNFTLARQELKTAIGQRETVGLCKLMAELEQMDKKDAAQIRFWLDRATAAFPDTAWQCSDCGHQPIHWHAHCPECRHFDSVKWQSPRYAVYPIAKAAV